MSDILDSGPETKSELDVENRELKQEIQECHSVLDRVGADSRDSVDGTKTEALRLPARLCRLCLEVLNKLLGGSNGR